MGIAAPVRVCRVPATPSRSPAAVISRQPDTNPTKVTRHALPVESPQPPHASPRHGLASGPLFRTPDAVTTIALPPPAPPRQAPETGAADGSAALLLGWQASLLSHASLEDAATAFAAELADALRCDRVSVGLAYHGSVRLLAVSHGDAAVPQGTAAAALESAMNEACDQGTSVLHPAPSATAPLISLAHQRLTAGIGGGACSIPFVIDGRISGALCLERSNAPFSAREVALCEDAACFAGPLLELKRDATASWWRRLRGSLRQHAATLVAPGHVAGKLAAATLLLAAVAAILIPIPYRVSASARIEGSVQRVIAAPADGFLQRANVRAGDSVRAGQVLAELAGEDLLLEQRRRQSELRQHENAYKGAMARADRAQMVIHQARAGEAQAMLELVEGQLERAQIVAPFDGVIIKGDLAQNLGAPVQKGEVLLTLSPTASFRLIVEVEETDIAPIEPGRAGRLVLAATPDRSLDFKVTRIVPVATAGDGRNFFEVEAMLDAPDMALRPGLRGVAKIEAGERSLLWMALHRTFDWLRLALWSLAP